MAEVLSRSRDDQSYFAQSSGGSGSLKRSGPSRTSLLVGSPSSSSHRTSSEPNFDHMGSLSRSMPSSGSLHGHQSFSDLSRAHPTPTPCFSNHAPKLSFELGRDNDRGLAFPAYDEVQFFHEDEPLDLPPSPRPEDETSDAESHDDRGDGDEDEDAGSTTDTTRSDSPLPTPTVADDTAIKHEPSRHVDYLSHDWREEDIWSSWRHIVSQRKVYGQRSRLENASWRTWAKSKYQLPTVSPETLNWLKESDVTWLYGPLQPASTHPLTQQSPAPSPQFSNSIAFGAKKPILKKRSMSEVMLQRSLSTSSLVKQAAAAVQAQQSVNPSARRPPLGRSTAYIPPSASLMVPSSRDQLDFLDLGCFSPRPSSGDRSPFECPKRHIRFDEKVEQCIAVEGKEGEYDDDDDDDESSDDEKHNNGSDSDSSDDGIVMMKRPKRKRPARKPLQRSSSSSRTIEKLPYTTLKNKTEPPQPTSSLVRSWSASKISPSASQETVRPSNQSRTYILPPEDDEDEEMDSDDTETLRSGAFANRRDSVAVTRARTSGSSSPSSEGEQSGLRRSTSGMFMPYEEDEDDVVAAGLFGKVSDTINTAKDIAHVIWNVGWRK